MALAVKDNALSIPRTLAGGFLGIAFLGAVLLWLPLSTTGGKGVDFLTALFTSVSAVCVTGLVVVDTGSFWSPFGQVVILALMQIGGLGIMTFSALVVVLTGGQISYRFRTVLKESLNRLQVKGVVGIAKSVITISLIIEGAGFLVFLAKWVGHYPFHIACWYALFHSVSAFCNAGFSLFPDSFIQWRGDFVINFVLSALILLGGIGFTVILELSEIRRIRKLSIHSRFAILMTVVLVVGGGLLIFLFETLKMHGNFTELSAGEVFLSSIFQSVTTRTAGFNTLDIGAMSDASHFLMIILMFIGASPGGTGGGIKTTTFGALMATLYSIIRGRRDVTIFDRRISSELLLRAFTIALLFIGTIAGGTLVMVAIEGRNFMSILFEVTSALGTVGLSTGITPYLTSVERIVIIIMMFAGRVGPLTLALALGGTGKHGLVRKPEGEVIVG